ncbi:DinB family protein [Mucilaginibacter celer]|uniref:DinB family protein n=1 Tax=Mucilaginibacter celer TaxID=2305508 RepID=A0A494VL92_9SPHI|nr:DinB family protein [Mucilaginibacter celer]AYL94301.1 DinB family protein [Mucilaginibacter celer]
MLPYLNKLEEDRKLLLQVTESLTEEQYNFIPEGFSNNIIWNLGHILVVSENILFKDSAFQRPVQEVIRQQFQRGSRPETNIDDDEIFLIRYALMQTVRFYKKAAGIGDQNGETKIQQGNFVQMISGERMEFLLFHEKIHYYRIGKLMEMVKEISSATQNLNNQ